MAYVNKGLFCPKCGVKSIVLDSALDKENNELYRKRKCVQCGQDFFTIEFVVDEDEKFQEFWLELKREHRRNYKKEREKK